MELETLRLNLQVVNEEDLNVIHELHTLPETDEFNTLGIPENKEVTKFILKQWVLNAVSQPQKHFTFAITLKESGEFIGLIALNLGKENYRIGEVWFKLHLNYWNKGYATESLKEIIRFGFEKLNLHRIEAGCAVANVGSSKVLEKAGMQKEGRKRQVLPLKSGWSDNFEYAILETD